MKNLLIATVAALALSIAVAAEAGTDPKWLLHLEKPRHAPGNYVSVGRVEVKRDGEADTEWGTICGPIDRPTAQRFCAALGFVSSGWTIVPNFPDGQGLIRLSNVSCGPNAPRFNSNCSYVESTSNDKLNNCTHLDDVGIGCFKESDWTPELHDAQFNLTHLADQNPNLAADIADMLSLPADVAVDVLSHTVEADDGKWGHFVFQFKNLTANPSGYNAWMAAATFHQISDSFLFKYGVYNAMSNIHQPMLSSPASANPKFWEWRLVEKDKFQGGGFTGVYKDSVRIGRVEMRPGSTAQWGTVCGNDPFGTEAAASICNTIAGDLIKGVSTLRTPWTVLPIPFYGGGDGPIWLNKVQCEDRPPLTFGNSCPRYTLSRPTDRGANMCDHTTDIGVNCQADITSSPLLHFFVAFVRVEELAQNTQDDVVTMLTNTICDAFHVSRDRLQLSGNANTPQKANGYYMVEFIFVDPKAGDVHTATKDALAQAIQLVRPEGLKKLFMIDQLLMHTVPKPGTPVPGPLDLPTATTPAPNYEPNVKDAKYVFAAEVTAVMTQDDLFSKVAAWANSKAFMFILTKEYTIVVKNSHGKNLNLKRVEFFIRGQPVSAAVTDALNEKLFQGLIGNATAYKEIGIHGFLQAKEVSASVDNSDKDADPDSHAGRTVFFIVCLILVICFFAALMYNRQRSLARDAQLYDHIGRRGLHQGQVDDQTTGAISMESGDVVSGGRHSHDVEDDRDTVGLRDNGEVVQGRTVDIQGE